LNVKSKWSSDNSVKPAFIVNNPATWRTATSEEKRWQSKLVRKRREGIPSQLSPHQEILEQDSADNPISVSKLVIQPVNAIKPAEPVNAINSAKPEMPILELNRSDNDHEDSWHTENVNPVQARSWSCLHSGEDDFKAWKAQVMSEINESKASLDKKFEQMEAANKKAATKKKVRIAEAEPIIEKDVKEVVTEAKAGIYLLT